MPNHFENTKKGDATYVYPFVSFRLMVHITRVIE